MTNITWLYNTNISKVSQNSQCLITIQNQRINKKEIEMSMQFIWVFPLFQNETFLMKIYTLSSKGCLIIHIYIMNNVYQLFLIYIFLAAHFLCVHNDACKCCNRDVNNRSNTEIMYRNL